MYLAQVIFSISQNQRDGIGFLIMKIFVFGVMDAV